MLYDDCFLRSMFVRGKVFHYDFHYVSSDFNIYDKFFAFRNNDGHCTLDTSKEDDVNIYPDSNRTMANRGNFNPADLLQFNSPADKFSRPSSATSTRMLPLHQDFRKMYDQSHLDKLFGAK